MVNLWQFLTGNVFERGRRIRNSRRITQEELKKRGKKREKKKRKRGRRREKKRRTTEKTKVKKKLRDENNGKE